MTTPNGFRTDSMQSPNASIDTRYATSREDTFLIQDVCIEPAVGATSRPAFPDAEWEKPETGWSR